MPPHSDNGTTSPEMDKSDLILYRLDQQAQSTERYREDVKEALTDAAKNTKDTFNRVFEQFRSIDGRLTSMEKWRYVLSGAMLMMSLLIGWYVAWTPKK